MSTFIQDVMRDSVHGVRRSLRLLTSFIVVRILTQSQHHIDTPCSQSRSRETETREAKHKMLKYDRSTETSIGFQCYCVSLGVTHGSDQPNHNQSTMSNATGVRMCGIV